MLQKTIDEMVGKLLLTEAVKLISNKERMTLLSENIKKLAVRDADIKIAKEVLKLAEE